MTIIKMRIFKVKLLFYSPCEVKCMLQNEVSTDRQEIRVIWWTREIHQTTRTPDWREIGWFDEPTRNPLIKTIKQQEIQRQDPRFDRRRWQDPRFDRREIGWFDDLMEWEKGRVRWEWATRDKEREKITKILNASATLTVHICTVIVAIVHLCTILHPLKWVFFFVKICKMKGFLHFASTSTVTVVRAFNILIFFDSVGSVRERGSEWGNNKKL